MRRHFTFRRLLATAFGVIVAYVVAAYVVMPLVWNGIEGRNAPASDMLTLTPMGIPGDPINVGFVGSREEVLAAFNAAKWHPADPLTLRSSLGMGLSVLFMRPYEDAPVSTLLFEGRRQDFAFEREQGESPYRRHHVRLWQAAEPGEDGRPLWLGAASFDRAIGLSRDTGEITHHIAADIDAERDRLIADLDAAGALLSKQMITGIGATDDGRNGEGDRYTTDGMAAIAVLEPDGQ